MKVVYQFCLDVHGRSASVAEASRGALPSPTVTTRTAAHSGLPGLRCLGDDQEMADFWRE